jgi:hypothetical protein
MRPVTAPCDHDPPSRYPVGTRSPWLDPPDKASDRPLMRPVTVALSSHPDMKPSPVVILMTARPFQGREERSGRWVVAQRPKGAPLQGAKVTNRISGESEPLMRRATESLSVMHVLSTQRRTRCGAWCEERAGAAAGAGATRQAMGVILSTGHSGKQGR